MDEEKSKTKPLEVLVIEDDAKHLADAKAKYQPVADAGKAAFDFVSTYVEAQEKMAQKKYDGIISDVFFPYDANGWDEGIALKCDEAIQNSGEVTVGSDKGSYKSNVDESNVAYNKWKSGKSMHPTGVLMAEQALEEKVPIVLCTDTYHHNFATEPVFQFAKNKGICLVDGSSQLGQIASAPEKEWDKAYDLLVGIILGDEPGHPEYKKYGPPYSEETYKKYLEDVKAFKAKYLP